MITRSLLASVLFGTILVTSAAAQSGGNFVITKSVIAGGGGQSTGGTFVLDGTIGQPFGGTTSTGGTFSLLSGFWSPVAAPSPTPSGSIAGNVEFAVITKPVPGVTLNAVGSVNTSSLTDASGAYLLAGLGTGPYMVTPSKPRQQCGLSNGVFAFDAARIAQFVVGLRTFNADQAAAARVSGNPTITSFDASLIARRVVGICTDAINRTGQWVFNPAGVSYAEVLTTISGENYRATLMGDVDGDWNPAGPNRPVDASEDPNAVEFSLPNLAAKTGSTINVPLSIGKLNGVGVNAYQFDIEYDPTVVEPAEIAAELAGTLGDGLSIAYNVPISGLLKVAIYGALPSTGDGVYANLRFTVVGEKGTSSPLTLSGVKVNDNSYVRQLSGSVTVAAADNVLKGTLVSARGRSIGPATIELTSTTGTKQFAAANSLGQFEFGALEMGQVYTVAVRVKGYAFTPVKVSVVKGLTEVTIVAEP